MKKTYLFLLTNLVALVVFAQEKTTDVNVDINKNGNNSNWYASPWVWVVGAAVFIILLVALTSGRVSRRSGERTTVTKTVRKDTDV